MESSNHNAAEWNPRYVAYARAHGLSPEGMKARDQIEWPGGVMCGFILWNSAQLRAASKAIPAAFHKIGGRMEIADHDAYDRWLANHAEAKARAQ